MLKVTCTNCGRDVRITPDAEFCSSCGENLKVLIQRDQMSLYFYDRASSLTETASNRAALHEAQRGLEHVDSAELQLLAAILAETEREYDLMRQHVSRIPVSDRLRDEGEWLLRSHQARKSANRLGSRQPTSASQRSPIPALEQPTSPSMRMQRIGQNMSDTQIVRATNEIVPTRKPVNVLDPARGSRRSWPGLVTVLLLLGVVWLGWRFLSGGFGNQQAATDGQTMPMEVGTDQGEAIQPALQPESVEPQVTATQNQQPSAPATPQQNAPSNAVPDTVVEADAQSVVAAEVNAGVSQPFDLNQFLLEKGRSDLAAFRLDATLLDNELTISGAVDSTTQREEVMALAETTSELYTISATDLLVRQPDRYTIESGDNLWLVAEKLYGNGERWEEIYEANQDILAAPDAITVGQQLKIPQDR